MMPPTSTNPQDYPRSLEITEEDERLAVARETQLRHQVQDAAEQLALLQARHAVAQQELFLTLHRRHPEIRGRDGAMVGWGYRIHEGRPYYVAWDLETMRRTAAGDA